MFVILHVEYLGEGGRGGGEGKVRRGGMREGGREARGREEVEVGGETN